MRNGLMVCVLAATARVVLGAEPSDVVVYGDHVPAVQQNGSPFVNPFLNPPGNTTRLQVAVAPGIRIPDGAGNWGFASWGKYVFTGNYDVNGSGVFQSIEDQRIGVLNSETRAFCEIDVDPAHLTNASIEHIGVGDPQARQTRIYFQGYETGHRPLCGSPGAPPPPACCPTADDPYCTSGAAFGYVEADLNSRCGCAANGDCGAGGLCQDGKCMAGDGPRIDCAADADCAVGRQCLDDPCDPVSGWKVVRFTENDMNAHTVVGPSPCPGVCAFDGLGVLDADTVALNGWGHVQIVVAHIGPGGGVPNLAVSVYPLPAWQPIAGGACYTLRPVARPSVDPTRALGDRRFTSVFDITCDTPPSGSCAPNVGLCPVTGASCLAGQTCPNKYCDLFPGTDCQVDADCTLFGIQLGHCVNACFLQHPGITCSTTTSQHCVRSSNCPSSEKCVCLPGRPAQEYKFDGTNITTTSAFFKAALPNSFAPLGLYDSSGALWITDYPAGTTPVNYTGPVLYYKKLAGQSCPGGETVVPGEHCYYTASAPTATEAHAYDIAIGFPTGNIFGDPHGATQVGSSVYMLSFEGYQRAFSGYGTWTRDTSYKAAVGYGVLPAESLRCNLTSSNAGAVCEVDADCPGGLCLTNQCNANTTTPGAPCAGPQDCQPCTPPGPTCKPLFAGCSPFGGGPLIHAFSPVSAGSPPSLWTSSSFSITGPKSAYIARVPVASDVPDGLSGVRPSIAWSGDRLWLVAEHNGLLKYRVRDDGQWSAWFSLPSNITTAGGGTIVADATTAIVFARTTAGLVYASTLQSPQKCTPGSCTWSNWAALPALPNGGSTAVEPAAAMVAPTHYVAVRNTLDSKVYLTFKFGTNYWPWYVAGTQTTDAAPSLTFHSDNNVWLAVRQAAQGLNPAQIKYTRVQLTSVQPWAVVGTTGAPTWGTAPAIVSDGTQVHVFAGRQGTPQDPYYGTYHAVFDAAGGWGSWRPLVSGGGTTRQPAAANVHGDINLVTHWYVVAMQEQLVPGRAAGD